MNIFRKKPKNFQTLDSDSDLSICLPRYEKPLSQLLPPDHILLIIEFEDCAYTKRLEFEVFKRWDIMEDLIKELWKDGIMVEGLWDELENMEIQSGDWEARVRPGWIVRASCFDFDEKYGYGDLDVEQDDGEILSRREEWWFARWRRRVEAEGRRRVGSKKMGGVLWHWGLIHVMIMIMMCGGVVWLSL